MKRSEKQNRNEIPDEFKTGLHCFSNLSYLPLIVEKGQYFPHWTCAETQVRIVWQHTDKRPELFLCVYGVGGGSVYCQL